MSESQNQPFNFRSTGSCASIFKDRGAPITTRIGEPQIGTDLVAK